MELFDILIDIVRKYVVKQQKILGHKFKQTESLEESPRQSPSVLATSRLGDDFSDSDAFDG